MGEKCTFELLEIEIVEVSLVNFRKLDTGTRLDPEYYMPEFLAVESTLKDKKCKKLGDISKAIKSFGAYALYNQVVLVERGIPFIRCKDIKEGFVDFSDVQYIDEATNELLNKSSVNPSMVMLTMSGTVGNSAIAANNWQYPINSNQDIAKIETNNSVNPYYLTVFLNSKYGMAQTKRLPVGSIQQHIFLWQLKELLVFTPTNEFQSIIENIYIKAINSLSEVDKAYSQAEQTLLSELGLMNWKPKHQLSFVKNFSESRNANRMDAEYFQPKYDEIKRVINRGKCIPLGKCFDLISSNYFDYVDDGDVGVIKTKQLSGRFISFEVESKTSKKILEDNGLPEVKDRDVLFASMGVGSLGKANIYYEFENNARTKFTVDSTIRIMRQNPNSEIGPELLALYLSSIVGQELIYQNIVGTSGIISIYKHYLENLPIPVLDQSIQDILSRFVKQAHKSRIKSNKLLDIAKRAVEIAIEKNEGEATRWLSKEVEN